MIEQIKLLKLQKERSGSWGYLNKERLSAIQMYAGDTILDAGCSSGNYVKYLSQKGYNTFGVDLLEDDHWLSMQSSPFALADVTKLPFDSNSVDTILFFEVLEHLTNVKEVLLELKRIARKNIILSVPNCSQAPVFPQAGLTYFHWIDRTHQQFFDKEILRSIFHEVKLTPTSLQSINPIRPETLFLNTWHIPLRASRILGSAFTRIPFKKQYYMTLLAVVSVDES